MNALCQGVHSVTCAGSQCGSSEVVEVEESYERNNNHQGENAKQKSAGGANEMRKGKTASKGCCMCVCVCWRLFESLKRRDHAESAEADRLRLHFDFGCSVQFRLLYLSPRDNSVQQSPRHTCICTHKELLRGDMHNYKQGLAPCFNHYVVEP